MKKILTIILAALLLFVSNVGVAAQYDASYDLTTVSSRTAEELAEHMHPETRHLAADVVRICAREGISAEFIITLMRWERRVDLHNYFGWTDRSGLMRFSSDLECLETVIPRIRDWYLTEGGRYYNGVTVADVNIYYNGTEIWQEIITAEMLEVLNSEK